MACRRKHTDELLGDHILSGILMHVVFQVRGPCVAEGDQSRRRRWSGGPISRGDQRRRDRSTLAEVLIVETSSTETRLRRMQNLISPLVIIVAFLTPLLPKAGKLIIPSLILNLVIL